MPPIQYWFTGGALGAFLGLLGALGGVSALGYAWYRAAVTELEAASGKAASALQKLKADRVKAAAYGEGEAALFLDDSGYLFYSGSSPKSKIQNWIEGRMRRISELLKRTDTLNPRSDFEPAKFE